MIPKLERYSFPRLFLFPDSDSSHSYIWFNPSTGSDSNCCTRVRRIASKIDSIPGIVSTLQQDRPLAWVPSFSRQLNPALCCHALLRWFPRSIATIGRGFGSVDNYCAVSSKLNVLSRRPRHPATRNLCPTFYAKFSTWFRRSSLHDTSAVDLLRWYTHVCIGMGPVRHLEARQMISMSYMPRYQWSLVHTYRKLICAFCCVPFKIATRKLQLALAIPSILYPRRQSEAQDYELYQGH